eukprot:3120028-Rhodomonas_salina.2
MEQRCRVACTSHPSSQSHPGPKLGKRSGKVLGRKATFWENEYRSIIDAVVKVVLRLLLHVCGVLDPIQLLVAEEDRWRKGDRKERKEGERGRRDREDARPQPSSVLPCV